MQRLAGGEAYSLSADKPPVAARSLSLATELHLARNTCLSTVRSITQELWNTTNSTGAALYHNYIEQSTTNSDRSQSR